MEFDSLTYLVHALNTAKVNLFRPLNNSKTHYNL